MGTKKEIKGLIEELAHLGAVLPGSVSKLYNVCGKKGCACKDPVNPRKHGPYNHLSFTIAGESSSKFIKDDDLPAVLNMRRSFQRLKEICQELPLAYMTLVRKDGVEAAGEFGASLAVDFASDEFLSEKRLTHQIRELTKQVDSWRGKAREKTFRINALKSNVKQLTLSRDKWKKRSLINEKDDIVKKTNKAARK